MSRILIASILLLSTAGFAEDEILLTRKAEAYFEAKEYDNARELFEKLEGEKLQPWQRARLQYNIGTIYLDQGEWEMAADSYSDISELPKNAYSINRALKTNVAILQYRKGLELSSQGDLKLDDYSKLFFLYRDALKNIEEAQKAECDLSVCLGQKKCEKSIDLSDLSSAVKRELVLVNRKYGDARISESPVKDGVPFLLTGVKIALSHLLFLDSKQLDDNLKKNYLKLFTRDAESWLLLWEEQLNQLEGLKRAFDYYLEGIQKMRNERLEESRLAFLNSEKFLIKLIQKLWGMDPLIKLLQNLLAGYERTFDQVPIQVSSLYQIATEQMRVEEIAETTDLSLEFFSVSNNFLKKSHEYARQAKHVHARFFLHEARQWIRRLLRSKTGLENAPDQILENAIEDQTHALTLHRLSQVMEGENEDEKELLINSQEQTLTTAAPFISAVLDKEIREYPTKCQCKPWNKVIPLFDKGKQAADQSMELIAEGRQMALAMKEQEKTIKLWKEALERLRHPEEEEPPSPEKQSEAEPEEQSPPPEPEKSSSFNDVLKLLQQMDQDDRRPEPSETQPQQGLRPW